MAQFEYLKYGLAAVLTFVSIKTVIVDFYHIEVGASLAVVAAILTLAVLASLWKSEVPTLADD